MEKLQATLIEKINELIAKADGKDVSLLDVLNRLLGTVSSYLLGTSSDNSKDVNL